MSELVFSQMISVSQLQQLLETQFRLTGVPGAILDSEERMLASVGWQDICARFHRCHPVTNARCRESDAYIKAHIDNCPAGYVDYRCQNGLWDVAMPIFIEGRHLATFFTGQFFYDDDPPDREFFRDQAGRFGFDEEEYLAALERVPILSRSHIQDVMKYLRSLVEMIAEMGLKNLRLNQEVEQRDKLEREAFFFRYLVENSRDPIYVLDPTDGYRMYYVNAATCAHFGWDENILLQTRVPDWDPHYDAARMSALYKQLKQGKPARFETVHRVASGALIPVEVMAGYLEYEGRPLIAGNFHNISERRAMQAALREREHNLVEAQRIARVGNWSWDLFGQLQSASEECWRILGIPAETFAGSEDMLFEMIRKEDRKRLRNAIVKLVRNRQPCATEYRLQQACGEELVIQDQREPVFGENGRMTGMVGTIQDITDQVRIAEDMRAKDLLLLQQSRMAAMGEMISYIAHQWRQPLHLLNLLVYSLGHPGNGGGSDEQRQQAVAQVENLLQHMSSTIDDFSNFFRTDQGPMPFDLKESASKILELIATDLKKHGIEIVFDAVDGLLVTGHGNEFSHVLLNLLNNAKEALIDKCVAAPRIHIHVFQDGGKKIITVRDNAGGVPESVREQLFESYFTTKENGTGIGLYISKVIIEKRMQGSIAARNTGAGLEFRIEL
ncbi:PocR ligand-binding domain-containing protein [Syntrophotalea carbinolica]|nr:PocR ligand-binding domain-containing protein [Syntrophotalea carbinolica]